MREILFRAKRKNWRELPKEQWWVEGDLRKDRDLETAYISGWDYYTSENGLEREPYEYEINPETICQYTEWDDKNGRHILDNDITKLVSPDGKVRYFKVSIKKTIWSTISYTDFGYPEVPKKIELNAVCFESDGHNWYPCLDENCVSDVDKMEVVGNIFDNPELLE